MLDAAIADAKIAYESALTQYAKLTVRSPISGVIGEIFVSEGQEIAVGTKIFTVSGKRKQQIQVAITANEYQYIQQEKPVVVEYQNQILTGAIDSISPVADKTNLFKVIIQLSSDIELLGDVAKVNFPLEINTARLLPLEKVKIVDENQALVPVLSGGSLEYLPVEIHSIW